MTSPKIATFHRGGSRFYEHPKTGDKVPGVTSVLGMLPKGFLKFWASKLVAEAAVEMTKTGELALMVNRDPDGAVDYLKRSPDRNTRAAADTGTAAHGVFEALALGHPVGAVTPTVEPFLRQYQDFLDTVQPTFLRTEDTVWSEKHLYAGSFDFFGEIQGVRCWGDNKTTRSGVHAEVALQLAAYSRADYVLDGDTGEQLLMPEADRGVVVHVRPEGWGLYEVPIGQEVFDYFLALREVFDWEKGARKLIGKPAVSGAVQIEGGSA